MPETGIPGRSPGPETERHDHPRTLLILAHARSPPRPLGAQQPTQQAGPLPINQDARQVAQRAGRAHGAPGPLRLLRLAAGRARTARSCWPAATGWRTARTTCPSPRRRCSTSAPSPSSSPPPPSCELEMEGKLSVNDPVSPLVPQRPRRQAGDDAAPPADALVRAARRVRRRLRGGGARLAGGRDPRDRSCSGRRGRATDYSNAGYSLLGMVVEKASGMPYEQYLRAEAVGARGDDAHRLPRRAVAPGRAGGGLPRGGQRWGTSTEQRWAADGPWWNLRGNGGVLSNVADLFRWHQALEGDAILSAEAKREAVDAARARGRGGELALRLRLGDRTHRARHQADRAQRRQRHLLRRLPPLRGRGRGDAGDVQHHRRRRPPPGSCSRVARTIFGGGEVAAPPAAVPAATRRAPRRRRARTRFPPAARWRWRRTASGFACGRRGRRRTRC